LFILTGGLISFGHIVPFAVEKGVAEDLAALGMGILSVANGIGRLVFGALWDRLGRKKTMALDALMMGGSGTTDAFFALWS